MTTAQDFKNVFETHHKIKSVQLNENLLTVCVRTFKIAKSIAIDMILAGLKGVNIQQNMEGGFMVNGCC